MTRIRFTLDPHASDEENYATIVAIAEKYGRASRGEDAATEGRLSDDPGSTSGVVPKDALSTIDLSGVRRGPFDVDE